MSGLNRQTRCSARNPEARDSASFLGRTLVLIPALNEELCVEATVRSWLEKGVRRVRVVDNGSEDGTARIAAAAGAEVLVERRRGYGAAAWRGLRDWPADCEWALFSSADGSDRLSEEEAREWQKALERDERIALVLGDRTFHRSARRHLKWTQRFGNWICCAAIAWGWGRRFRDMASLRLVRRSALERMELRDRGFGWNVEMQARAVELGMRTVELPVGYFPRRAGESKISGNLMGTIRAGKEIVGMLFYLWRLRAGRAARVTNEWASRPG